MSHKIESNYLGGLRVLSTHLASNTEIITDAPVDNNGKGESFSPTDLVATALGTCMTTVMGIYAEKNGKSIEGISVKGLERLVDYSWPGNVRELENTIERAVVLAQTTVLDEGDMPESVIGESLSAEVLSIQLGTPLEEIERRVIRETLKFTDGDKKRAAQLLGIATRTIYRKID